MTVSFFVIKNNSITFAVRRVEREIAAHRSQKWLLCSVKIGVAQSLTTICLLYSVTIGVTHHNSSFNEKLVNSHWTIVSGNASCFLFCQ